MFDLELERTADWISINGYSKVAVQLPEGLKLRATEIADALNASTGAEIIILGRPCYGACDFFENYKSVADALVHYGHSTMPSLGKDPDILFVEARAEVALAESFADFVNVLPEKVGVLASIQYIGLIPDAVRVMEAAGKEVHVSAGDTRIMYPGQVLGCNCSTAEAVADSVEAFLFLGEGNFHPLAAAFGAEKKLFVYNPVTGESRNIDEIKDRILRKRFAAITVASEAENFVIIVSNKIGQNRTRRLRHSTLPVKKNLN